MSKHEPTAMRATLRPPCVPDDHDTFLGTLWQEPEPPLRNEIDVILMPAVAFNELLAFWRGQVDVLQRNGRDAEARRVQDCLRGIEALFARTHFDTTRKVS